MCSCSEAEQSILQLHGSSILLDVTARARCLQPRASLEGPRASIQSPEQPLQCFSLCSCLSVGDSVLGCNSKVSTAGLWAPFSITETLTLSCGAGWKLSYYNSQTSSRNHHLSQMSFMWKLNLQKICVGIYLFYRIFELVCRPACASRSCDTHPHRPLRCSIPGGGQRGEQSVWCVTPLTANEVSLLKKNTRKARKFPCKSE